jgi:hypothetical protein
MIQVSDSGVSLDVVSQMPSGRRFLFASFALIPLLVPYELMLRVQWNDYRHPACLLAAIISAGAVAVSGALDIHLLDGAPILPHRTLVLPLSSLESVHVRTREWSDGAPSYTLMVKMSDGATFDSGPSWSREDIERGKVRVEVFLDRAKR